MSARRARRRWWAAWLRPDRPDIPHRLDRIADRRDRLVIALRARDMNATPYGSRGVIVSHPAVPGPRLVGLRYHPDWNRLVWCWSHGDHVDPLGRIDEVGRVADLVTEAISGPAIRP